MKGKFLLFALFLVQVSFSHNSISEEKKVEDFIRVWGLLKYYHPEVSKGTFDFDQEFIKEFEKLETIKSQEKWNEEIIRWINEFDIGKSKFKWGENHQETAQLFAKNIDFQWIDNANFEGGLQQLLNKIKNNVAYKDFYASRDFLTNSVDFEKDKALESFNVREKSHRLLFLASFWNKMNYWNVNIYLTKVPWSDVLVGAIPDFIQNDAVKFEKAKEKLFSKLNDSHANYTYSYTLGTLVNFPDFGGRIVNDSLVVTNLYGEKAVKQDAIAVGDVIYSIEGKSVKDYYTQKFSDVISVSTENYLKRAIEKSYLLASIGDSISVSFLRKSGEVCTRSIPLKKLKYYAERYTRLSPEKVQNWKMLTADIGYLNLDYIDQKDLEQAFDQFKNTKGIVIDLRNYPHTMSEADLTKYLYPQKKLFIKILGPLMPSYGKYDVQSRLKVLKNPFVSGENNKNYYKGKVVLLVDRSTASRAEFIGMAVQQAPNCYTMGEQTFGAVMNRNLVPLTDKTKIDFTGMGGFYPNDQNVQGKGLRIDYVIKETAKNFNKELYIEQAVKVIQN
jgi:carboxyl-terminal processing protease